MAKRPEGLSPSFNSIVSPQIPESQIFSWNFIRDYSTDRQIAATVRVYPEGSDVALLTLTETTDPRIEMSAELSQLAIDETYEWEVTTTSSDGTRATSARQPFQYATTIIQDGLIWPEGPSPYEYIGTRQYFDELKANTISVLDDYVVDSLLEQNALKAAENLFLSDVVPNRSDFEAMQEILNLIAYKENTYRQYVEELIGDGLGAEDIHKIYEFFDRLVSIAPRAPSNVYLTFDIADALQIDTGSADNRGLADLTIDVKWSPAVLEKGSCTINFLSDVSEDVAYYHINLQSGFSDIGIYQDLYFRKEDVQANNGSITFAMDHIDFEHLSNTKDTVYALNAVAVDKRGASSARHSRSYPVKDVPLGVDRYQLRAQKKDLQNKTVVKSWYDIYNGSSKAYVHKVTGSVDGHYSYAVRLYDKNGKVSYFYYIDDSIKVDPLRPPAAPKPKIRSVTTSSITLTWASVKDADSYEVDPKWTSSGTVTTTSTSRTISSLNEKTSYSTRVRAKNRAGYSAWVTVTGKTLAKPIVEYVQKGPKCRTWRTSYSVLLQSGGILRKSGGYMPEKDNREAMHGEWIELRNKYESGVYVRKGTRWGNHKTVFFLDYAGWQSRLKGKEIIDVKFYIKRKSSWHGYPDDGRFLNVYSHNYASASSLPRSSSGPNLAYQHKATGLDFDLGQGAWVTLPKAYGERLRDGKIKGIAFHHPSSTRTPYSYMRFDATTFQFKVRYK